MKPQKLAEPQIDKAYPHIHKKIGKFGFRKARMLANAPDK